MEELLEAAAEALAVGSVEEVLEAAAEALAVGSVEEVLEAAAEALAVGSVEEVLEAAAEALTVWSVEELLEAAAEALAVGSAEELLEAAADALTVGSADALLEAAAEALVVGSAEELLEAAAEALAELLVEAENEKTSDLLALPEEEGLVDTVGSHVGSPVAAAEPVYVANEEEDTELDADTELLPVPDADRIPDAVPVVVDLPERLIDGEPDGDFDPEELRESVAVPLPDLLGIAVRVNRELSEGVVLEETDTEAVSDTEALTDADADDEADTDTLVDGDPLSIGVDVADLERVVVSEPVELPVGVAGRLLENVGTALVEKVRLGVIEPDGDPVEDLDTLTVLEPEPEAVADLEVVIVAVCVVDPVGVRVSPPLFEDVAVVELVFVVLAVAVSVLERSPVVVAVVLAVCEREGIAVRELEPLLESIVDALMLRLCRADPVPDAVVEVLRDTDTLAVPDFVDDLLCSPVGTAVPVREAVLLPVEHGLALADRVGRPDLEGVELAVAEGDLRAVAVSLQLERAVAEEEGVPVVVLEVVIEIVAIDVLDSERLKGAVNVPVGLALGERLTRGERVVAADAEEVLEVPGLLVDVVVAVVVRVGRPEPVAELVAEADGVARAVVE